MPSLISETPHLSALEALEASLNSIYMQIGATFSHPTNLEPINLQISAAQLQQALPKQKFAFDDALNRLEYEINHTQSVLRRDMEAMRSQRGRMKEEPKGDRETTGAQPNGNAGLVASEQDEKVAILDDSRQTADDIQSPDAIMVDGPPIPTLFPDTNINARLTNGEQEDSTSAMKETGPPTQGDSQFGLNQFDIALPAADNTSAINNTQGLSASNSDFKVGTMEEDELDSLFLQNDGPDAGELNLEITADSQQEPDVNSLLPGLEFYANENSVTPGAFEGMPDLSGPSFDSGLQLDTTTSNNNDPLAYTLGADINGQEPMGDSNFDDWLAGLGGDAAQQADGLPNNAEGTQFDDNFFTLD